MEKLQRKIAAELADFYSDPCVWQAENIKSLLVQYFEEATEKGNV